MNTATDKAARIREIVERQQRTNRYMRRHASDAWMRLNLTVPQVKSLFFIVDEGGTNSRKLATALGVTPPNVTGIVDRLVDQGLVTRQENPQDRRMSTLLASPKGEELVADLRERTGERMAEVLDHLTAEELAMVAKGLALVEKALRLHEGEQPVAGRSWDLSRTR